MKARYYLLGCLALAACDEATQLETADPVVVNFAQPFPANAPDLPGFRPRDLGQYTTLTDTSKVLVMSKKALVRRYFERLDANGALLDSLHIPRHAGSGLGPMQLRYGVQKLATDSFRLRIETSDTLLSFVGPQVPRLRYYRGYYYTSTPSRQDSTKWTVRRLAVANHHITQQLFNPDSLRVQALDPTGVQRRRNAGQLVITLAPQPGRATEQVSKYAGLWLDLPTSSPADVLAE
jgi:hypothetical protein